METYLLIETSAIAKPKDKCRCFYHPNDCGEDSFFICRGIDNDEHKIISFGVADGVGGWRQYNIDPGIFARRLMENASVITKDRYYNNKFVDPHYIINDAYNQIKDNREVFAGSCTYCAMTFDCRDDYVITKTTNLGDSGYIIIRNNSILYRSIPQRDNDAPYQLSLIPEQLLREISNFISTPITHAENREYILLENDLIIIGSDGLWDNIDDMNNIINIIIQFNNLDIPLNDIAELLMTYALSYYDKPDDITIIIGKVRNSINYKPIVMEYI